MSEPYSESNSEIIILATYKKFTQGHKGIYDQNKNAIPNAPEKQNKPQRDQFKLKNKNKPKFNEQLTVHRTLDTALWNIWQELLDQETKYIQTRSDNLTKKKELH